MTSVSANGWPVITSVNHCVYYQAFGIRWRFATPPVAQLFRYFNEQFDARVERIDPAAEHTRDDWTWANRPVTGSKTVISNHASATAEDLNAVKHPRGVALAETYNAQQIRTVRQLLLETADSHGRPVIRWGGTYVHSPIDSMHFELDATADQLADALNLLGREGKL